MMPGMDTASLTLWKLEIFCHVLEEKSFSKAARVMGISQPTVSGHVADLERLFGMRLFDRRGGEIIPTRAGELLFEQGRKLNLLKEETVRVMHNLLGVVEGAVTIGGSTIPGTYLLPAYLARFKEKHPGVHVTLKIGDSAEIVHAVIEGGIELGVVGSQVKNAQIRQTPFVSDELVLIVPAGHALAKLPRVTAAQVSNYPLVVRERGSGTRELLERALADAGGARFEDLGIVCELGSSEAIVEAVISGLGLSFVSRWAVERPVKRGELVAIPFEGADLRREFAVITHERRTLSPIARALLDTLKKPEKPEKPEKAERGSR